MYVYLFISLLDKAYTVFLLQKNPRNLIVYEALYCFLYCTALLFFYPSNSLWMDIKVLHRDILMGPSSWFFFWNWNFKYFISHFYHNDIILLQIFKQYRSIYNKKCKVFSDSLLPTFLLYQSQITTGKLVQDVF